jgi:hypothetical protein
MVNSGKAKKMKYEALRKKIIDSGIYKDLSKDDNKDQFKAKMKMPDFLYNHYGNKNYHEKIRPDIKPVQPLKSNMHIKVDKKDMQCLDITLFPTKLGATTAKGDVNEIEDNQRAIAHM